MFGSKSYNDHQHRVLVLAGNDTASKTADVCAKLKNVKTHRVETVAEALQLVDSNTWLAVVVALGTDHATCIFENEQSQLLHAARNNGQCVIVYSHTACRNSDYAKACKAQGAFDVLDSRSALTSALRTQVKSVPSNRAKEVTTKKKKKDSTRYKGRRLAEQIKLLPRPLLLQTEEADSTVVRFVCVSDTHHHHTRIAMPAGDVMLHSGDFIGNYGKKHDIAAHLTDFLEWIVECSQLYQLVVLVAGNHDTLLDTENYPYHSSIKAKFLEALPANVHYLQHSGISFRGLHIWGSPTTPCRVERLGSRYYSDGFERTVEQRTALYDAIPDGGCDVLVTHTPPQGMLCASGEGDECLMKRLTEMQHPPQFHVFGHSHDWYGVGSLNRQGDQGTGGGLETVFVNAAQEGLLRQSKDSTGNPIAFDIATKQQV